MASSSNKASGSGAGKKAPELLPGNDPARNPSKKAKKIHDPPEKDRELKKKLELCVERAQDPPSLLKLSLDRMREEVRSSMSSLNPKPLKFLRPHYRTLEAYYEIMPDHDLKKQLADMLSALAMTMSAEGQRDSLKYRLLDSDGDFGSWGYAYVRNLTREIVQEYAKRQREETPTLDLIDLVEPIVAFYMKHNAEHEAVDLLMEVEDLYLLGEYGNQHVNTTNFHRICLYLRSAARYLPRPDDLHLLDIAHIIYLRFGAYANALQISLLIDNMKCVKQVFASCGDVLQKRQLCFMLARHGMPFELDEYLREDRYALWCIINNLMISKGYFMLARDIDVIEPKSPIDIYKANAAVNINSATEKLAATFVNAFVNAGFGQDKLLTVPSDNWKKWILGIKGHGKVSAAASLGLICLWNPNSAKVQFSKYRNCANKYVVVGTLLGVGIFNCNIKNDPNRALVCLYGWLDQSDPDIRIGAIMGLGIAYSGSRNEQIRTKLSRILNEDKSPIEVIAFTAVSLGMVYLGSCNEEVAQSIILVLRCRSETGFQEPIAQFLPLGLGLLYLGKQERAEATAEVCKTFNETIRTYCDVTLLSCAYAGTGNVLKVQNLLGHCAEHLVKGETHQGPAVLGIAMVAMAEELGIEMGIRSFKHLLQYGEQNIRRAVPLALGLLCISNPKADVIDTLSRLSQDADSEVAMAAIISLGLIGAGTNDAQIAGMLRNLSSRYYTNEGHLFCVRIAQGLVYLGKGLLTLNPRHSDFCLPSPTALAGLITVLHACLDMKAIILGKFHFVLYFLVLAMQPRMLMTLDENFGHLSVPVRVGQAVDAVCRAGQPRTITGFRNHLTPVILAAGERAELATEEYLPLSPFLEGFVILKGNPNYRGPKSEKIAYSDPTQSTDLM